MDWINENSLNKNIRTVINDLKINDFTKPINVPSGFLILQINEIKKTKIEHWTKSWIKKNAETVLLTLYRTKFKSSDNNKSVS